MHWLQTQGSYISIENNCVKYFHTKEIEGAIHDKANHKKYTGIIQSSEYFEGGIIRFNLNFHDHQDAYVTMTIFDSIQVGANSGFSKKAFSIRQFSPTVVDSTEVLSSNIDKNTLLLNHDYEVEVQIAGSFIKLLLDKVQICNATVSRISTPHSQIKISLRSKGQISIKNFILETQKPKVFVVMQFSEDYNHLYSQVIKPVCELFGYECYRGDEYFTNGSILKEITDAINESAIIIADITPNNANVFYEVGYAHALNKPTILLSDKKRDKLPFDISGFRTLFYDNTIAGKSEVETRLTKHLKNIQSS